MQRAILGYHAPGNFGDAVQSYAMLELLGSEQPVDVVDRDGLEAYVPSEASVLLMNGWFLHRPESFWLAPNVTPAMVGIHASPMNPVYSRYPPFADVLRESSSVRKVFKRAQPVGARDLHTLGLLQELGIDSYFAGCPTMTLRPRGIPANGTVVAIDVPEEICEVLERQLGRLVIKISNRRDSSWSSAPALRRDVEPYLEILERADLVVTSRLHAALPAHALGTRVVFAPRDTSDPRFSGLADFLPVVVPLERLLRRPVSLFDESDWSPARDVGEQARVIRNAVDAALNMTSVGSEAPRARTAAESELLLLELERAAVVRDRVRLADRFEQDRKRGRLARLPGRVRAVGSRLATRREL
jgi:hypothetical protein